jgi:hypothetical protein
MTYPDGIDALVNVNANDTLAAGGHAARHNSVNTALVEIKNMLGPSPAGKIMQIVRATDSTQRTTTSTSYVDVTGMSVTITPQKDNSAILVVAAFRALNSSTITGNFFLRIADASDNPISGFQEANVVSSGSTLGVPIVGIAYATPATTSAVTFKLRFRTSGDSGSIMNHQITGQMYAIEVSA